MIRFPDEFCTAHLTFKNKLTKLEQTGFEFFKKKRFKEKRDCVTKLICSTLIFRLSSTEV